MNATKFTSCDEAIRVANNEAAGLVHGENYYGAKHVNAFAFPQGVENGPVALILALASMADEHAKRYESTIGDDDYAGPPWMEIWRATRHLLSMDMGRLDSGTLDSLLFDIARTAGFDEKEIQS